MLHGGAAWTFAEETLSSCSAVVTTNYETNAVFVISVAVSSGEDTFISKIRSLKN